MKLTVDEMIDAILCARSIEKLQQEVRDAMIESLVNASSMDNSQGKDGLETISPELGGASLKRRAPSFFS